MEAAPMSERLLPEDTYIVSGSAHPELAEQTVDFLGTELGSLERRTHPNGELYVRFEESIRGKHVVIMQSMVRGEDGFTPQDAALETMLMADAADSASAGEITVVAPFLAYARQDRKSKRGEPIGTRVLLRQLNDSGVRRVVTVDLHADQVEGTFKGPFDKLTGQPQIRAAMRDELAQYDPESLLVLAPDAGAVKMANRHGRELGAGVRHMSKEHDPTDPSKKIRTDDVAFADGRVCVLFDDMIDTAGTLVSAVEALKNAGAEAVYYGATHGFFSGQAIERLSDAPLDRLFIADTVPVHYASEMLGDKLRVVEMAPMLGRSLQAILSDESVSEIFGQENYQ